MSLLSSCGLEPEDLSVLAKLPEDILTVESLPQILKQIKGQKAASGSGRSPPPPSSSSTRRAVDQDLRPRPPVYGKDGSSFGGSAGRTRPSRFSGSGDFRTAPPLDERRRDSRPSFSSHVLNRARHPAPNRARDPASGAMPSKKQALDFHGTSPPAFPYSCSLCDIAVLSEKVWIQHVNTTGHADGQLNLLQRFPRWDCRLESAGRGSTTQGQRSDYLDASQCDQCGPEAVPGQVASEPANLISVAKRDENQSNQRSSRRLPLQPKFPPQAVDEASLRKLIEPFGKVGKVLMFPSLAFVEMGSSDQAKDLVKFYSSSDPEARKVKVEFNISNAFSFLQVQHLRTHTWTDRPGSDPESSQVVSFTPAPSGEDGRSDLLSIAKRFGEPLYTLFLPSKAFVEMKLSAEAQKLVDYYSASALRINGATIQVAFSSEYRTLLRVPSAQKYEDEPAKTKEPNRTRRARTRSRSRDRSGGGRQRRSGSGDRKRPEIRTRTRSRSRERHGTSSPGQNQNQMEGKPKEPQNPGKQPEPATPQPSSCDDEEQKPEPPGAGRTWTTGGKVLWREKLRSGNDFPDGGEKPATEEEEVKHLLVLVLLGQNHEVEFPVDLESCITLDEVKTDDEDEAPPADGCCEEDGKPGSPEPGPEPTGLTPDDEGSGSDSRTQEEPEPSEPTRSTETLEQEPDRTGLEPESQTRFQKVLETQRVKTPQESAAPPAEGATEPQKPVGAEFVRPVVGYFCNLCQLIFIDEDEAKLQHCATPAHYRKYQVTMETSRKYIFKTL
uniref:Matrin-3-like n=1 Tax=Poecilia formosa TaxID=48698 RepID=A0A096M938_POEFO